MDSIRKIFSPEEDSEDEDIIGVEEKIHRKVGPDDFEIRALLGKGSFGDVFLVR